MNASDRLLLLIGYWSVVLISCGWSNEDIRHAEELFRTHREEFIEVAEGAVAQYREKPEEFKLPPTDFYEYGWVSDADWQLDDQATWNPGSVSEEQIEHARSSAPENIYVEFVLENFYVPIVYITTDRPFLIYDTCNTGGSVEEKLEPNWYICVRDWN